MRRQLVDKQDVQTTRARKLFTYFIIYWIAAAVMLEIVIFNFK